MRLLGQFKIFLREIFATQKTSKNWITRQKQANTKQQNQQFFVHKNFIRGENCLFCVFFHLKSLLKKISVCLDSLIYCTTDFCNGEWLNCALEVLQENNIYPSYFSTVVLILNSNRQYWFTALPAVVYSNWTDLS